MSTVWVHRTRTGKVIYDRKPKPFTVRDARRVQSRVIANTKESPDQLRLLITSNFIDGVNDIANIVGSRFLAAEILLGTIVDGVDLLESWMKADPQGLARYIAAQLLRLVNKVDDIIGSPAKESE